MNEKDLNEFESSLKAEIQKFKNKNNRPEIPDNCNKKEDNYKSKVIWYSKHLNGYKSGYK